MAESLISAVVRAWASRRHPVRALSPPHPEGWTDFVRTPAPSPGPDHEKYGAAFWLWLEAPTVIPAGSHFMEGFGGQYTMILPSHDPVVVRIGHDKGQHGAIAD